MLVCSFLIESSSKLLVTRTGIEAQTSLISGRIRLLTLELLVLEWRKFYTFELEYLWGQLTNLDQILCVASLGVGKGCIMFWGRLDQNSGVHGNRKPPLTYNEENGVSTFSAGNQDRHKSLDEFDFRPLVSMAHLYVFLKWDLTLAHWTQVSDCFILAGNEDMHKILDKFEFCWDWTTHYWISCPWASKKFPIDL